MDSNLTVADPPPGYLDVQDQAPEYFHDHDQASEHPKPSSILTLDRNGFVHTHVRRVGEPAILYTIKMAQDYSKKTLTRSTSAVPIVSITRLGGMLPAHISFNGEPSYLLSKWLRKEPKPHDAGRTTPQ